MASKSWGKAGIAQRAIPKFWQQVKFNLKISIKVFWEGRLASESILLFLATPWQQMRCTKSKPRRFNLRNRKQKNDINSNSSDKKRRIKWMRRTLDEWGTIQLYFVSLSRSCANTLLQSFPGCFQLFVSTPPDGISSPQGVSLVALQSKNIALKEKPSKTAWHNFSVKNPRNRI